MISGKKVLITGGAGFIGSNLCEELIKLDNYVICLDNFSTGKIENIGTLLSHKNFKLVKGDIRNLEDCFSATQNMDYVLHHAALGSVPRSVHDPITTNEVNISGFLNMLIASRDNHIKRFIYAASSSTYGDLESLPKVEEKIGKPLSPYAITKYVNELYTDVFSRIYGMECIGLRYFNVFGRKQDPNGSYAAVIPLFIKQLIHHQSPVINGDGQYSRDFTYIDNVIQINLLSLKTSNPEAVNTVYNTAYGESTTLNELVNYIKSFLSEFDPQINEIESINSPNRVGDIPYSLASIEKAKRLLNYNPQYSLQKGLKVATKWYWDHLK
jgi:UDP-N-acetylglucosamine 4-epimerase